ncbi:MAG TPA: PEP-CTERM sorting domain-containing protein [Edaphobacter sp.]|nr:PEP-CTERM sorting domain-containing protein [Edaphobacter sp.]
MLKTPLSLVLFATLAAAPAALHADTYSFSISTAAANNDPASSFVATGTLTGPVDPFNSTAFDITSITGSANGYDFLGVVAPGTTNSQTTAMSNGFTFDNVLFTTPGAPHTDEFGFLLNLNSPIGTSLAHVYYTGVTAANPGGYEVDVVDPTEPGAVTPFSIDSFTITPSAVPEPSAFLLLGTGLLGVGGLIRHRLAAN